MCTNADAALSGVQTVSGIEVVRIPAGTFKQGFAAAPLLAPTTTPVRQVTISAPFWMARTEVTKGSFRQFVKAQGYTMARLCHTFRGTRRVACVSARAPLPVRMEQSARRVGRRCVPS